MSKVYYRYFTNNRKYGEENTPYLDSLAYTIQEFLYTEGKAIQTINFGDAGGGYPRISTIDCKMDGRIQLYDFMTMTLHCINAVASDYATAELKEYLRDLKEHDRYDSLDTVCKTDNKGIYIRHASPELLMSILWATWIYMKVFIDFYPNKALETRIQLLYEAIKESYPYSEEDLQKHPLIAHAPVAMKLMLQHIKAKIKKTKQSKSSKKEAPESVDLELQARIKELEAELEKARADIEAYESQGKGVSAAKHALLLTTLCHYLGGLPQYGRQSLNFILQRLYGYTDSTAEKALKQKVTQKDADALAKLFHGISPRVEKIIQEMPKLLEELNNERLRKLNEQKSQKK